MSTPEGFLQSTALSSLHDGLKTSDEPTSPIFNARRCGLTRFDHQFAVLGHGAVEHASPGAHTHSSTPFADGLGYTWHHQSEYLMKISGILRSSK
jgi:hypothetical protein